MSLVCGERVPALSFVLLSFVLLSVDVEPELLEESSLSVEGVVILPPVFRFSSFNVIY